MRAGNRGPCPGRRRTSKKQYEEASGTRSFHNRVESNRLHRVFITLHRYMADLVLMTVHAHPDDESSKGAGTVARYAAEGVRTVLVCCTGGEQGEILNPALDNDEVRSNIAEYRARE